MIEIGSEFNTNNCGVVIVTQLLPDYKVEIEFEDGVRTIVSKYNLKSGNIKNHMQPTVLGVGYNGFGPHVSHGSKARSYWQTMLLRAYCPKYKEKHPTYKDVTVCDEWLNYQNFAEWCVNRKQYGLPGLNLDKDIKVQGNKIYSPETCSLVPQHINKVYVPKSVVRTLPQGVQKSCGKFIAKTRSMSGDEIYLGTFDTEEQASRAYRVKKKEVIIETANFYKDLLDDDVYEALLKVEPT